LLLSSIVVSCLDLSSAKLRIKKKKSARMVFFLFFSGDYPFPCAYHIV